MATAAIGLDRRFVAVTCSRNGKREIITPRSGKATRDAQWPKSPIGDLESYQSKGVQTSICA